MVRILHLTNDLSRASGIVSSVINQLDYLDRTNFQYDFLCFKSMKNNYEEKIIKSGGRIFYIEKELSLLKFFFTLFKFFYINRKKFDIIHYHAHSKWALALPISMLFGIKSRIVHSHSIKSSENSKKELRNKILNKVILKFANGNIACSKSAGEYLYTNDNFEVILNGINPKRFEYNNIKRNEIREKLNISPNDKLLLHIGRFEYQKNHDFLIDIFNNVCKYDNHVKLLLIGEGDLKKNIQEKVANLKLSNFTIFLNNQDDISDYYNAGDIFILPSLSEGFGMVLLEAQLNGLNCITSNKVPEEAILYNTNQLDLNLPATAWGNSIVEMLNAKISREPGIIRLNEEYMMENITKKQECYYLKRLKKYI